MLQQRLSFVALMHIHYLEEVDLEVGAELLHKSNQVVWSRLEHYSEIEAFTCIPCYIYVRYNMFRVLGSGVSSHFH